VLLVLSVEIGEANPPRRTPYRKDLLVGGEVVDARVGTRASRSHSSAWKMFEGPTKDDKRGRMEGARRFVR
jgi:hypothetical protein